MIENKLLPDWLNCQIVNGIIELDGKPDEVEGELVLQIRDQKGYILREFSIEVRNPDEMLDSDVSSSSSEGDLEALYQL